jgi:hypothetical protein
MYSENSSENSDTFQGITEELAVAVSPPDLKGRINLRVDAALQEEIESIAEDTRYPLRSVSEVIRFCCISGLQRLREWQPAPTLLGQIKAASALVMRDKLQCESMELMQRLEERVDYYIDKGYYDEVLTLVGKVRSYFDGQEDDFWTQKLRDEIDTKLIEWFEKIDAKQSAESSGPGVEQI